MTQYGFFFDQSRCMGCHACALACKSWHQLPPGPLKYLKIYEYEKGAFSDVRLHFQWVPCFHCETPTCVGSCPVDAITKEEKYGAVIIDAEACIGCRSCYDECPYGAPVFESDDEGATAQKCDMCIDRLEMGDQPVCVMACRSRALDFGPIESLREKFGTQRDLEDMPGSRLTHPSVVVKPKSEKKQLVPYDAKRAAELMMKRDPMPLIFDSTADILEIPEETVGRSALVLKHRTAADLLHHTRNDEG
jgi:anaerobic dimethyl sulfoxide reductase subunit B